VSLEVKVESERVNDVGIDNGTSGKVTTAVHVLLVLSKEAHVVLLGANDKGDLHLRSTELGASAADSLEFVVDNVNVLTLGYTVTVDDKLLGEGLGVGLEKLKVLFHHTGKVLDDLTAGQSSSW
jgi:hypothetical protein